MATFYEFFAGGGMARAGLGENWQCLFANDIDPKKVAAYRTNWGADHLVQADVSTLTTQDLPEHPDLIWASFPCQDLSLAGSGAGLKGARSGTFWPFWDLVLNLKKENRAPNLLVLENVCGALTSHDGEDFSAICSALSGAEYKFGALVIDAAHFVPQSRPRLFIVAVAKGTSIPTGVKGLGPQAPWHSAAVVKAAERLSKKGQKDWIWWNLPQPEERTSIFADIIEEEPTGIDWHTAEQTQHLLDMMSPLHLSKVQQAQESGKKCAGTIYRRTRPDGNGGKTQRAEVRFDNIAGCLRTPGGGSSRQTIIVVEGSSIKTRLLSTREAARLMGLDDSYQLPERYNEAYHLLGDGLAVPAVKHLADNLLSKLTGKQQEKKKEAA